MGTEKRLVMYEGRKIRDIVVKAEFLYFSCILDGSQMAAYTSHLKLPIEN